jgi:hypothetical protein
VASRRGGQARACQKLLAPPAAITARRLRRIEGNCHLHAGEFSRDEARWRIERVEIYTCAKNIFPASQIGLPHAANRLRFAAKEQKFVTVRVTNIVVLPLEVSGVRIRSVP